MRFGFVKTACATPAIRVADCAYNAQQTVQAIKDAAQKGVEVLCLPELGLTGYTCEDLFFQPILQQGALDALNTVLTETADLSVLFAVGLPVAVQGKLYNCAAVAQQGRLLGLVPKTYLPAYNEFYEARHFAAAPAETMQVQILGQQVPFGTKLLFCHPQNEHCKIAVEICEDVWAPLPPSVGHAMAGATLIMNLSASDEVVGKMEYRRSLIAGQSARLLCGYLYADAGQGESTTDLVFAGHDLICENGSILAQTEPFAGGMIACEIDIQRLANERMKNTSFAAASEQGYTRIAMQPMDTTWELERAIEPLPFVPAAEKERAERCEMILQMQAQGLRKRMEHTRAATAVIGISGGLDSTLALLVITKAFQLMGKPLKDVVAVTMPCFGTTKRTKSNAEKLCEALGVSLQQVEIADTVRSNFADIGHSESVLDVTYENTQARVRTLVLMNLANRLGGLVIGTGDLSELALGWATYNGDHMSMYGVNGSVPKTLVRHIVETVAQESGGELQKVLEDILATPVSPELLPAQENGQIAQQTEAIVGPYELHDFFLYYAVRWGFEPKKIFWLAQHAFAGVYTDAVLVKWLRNFYRRFFSQQFKRSCLPDGPKVGTVTLSPRGDWRMPSDACASLWLAQVDELEQQIKTN